MNRFIIISPNVDQIEKTVLEKFPDTHYKIMSGVWAVAGTDKVPSDIATMLGIDGTVNNNKGVVFHMEDYNGFYDSTLWEKLNLWGRL